MSLYDSIGQSLRLFPYRKNSLRIRTIDLHTGGEPLRVIVDGFPELEGKSVLEYRADCLLNHDHLRKALMWEPRGHADMYGCILTPPNDESGDFGVVFMHHEGYSTMCGHAIIALAKLAAELGWKKPVENEIRLAIDAPCGRVKSSVLMENDKVKRIYFLGVPSFVVGTDFKVQLSAFGSISYDLAYGGAFYAYVEAHQFGLDLVPENYNKIIALGKLIKQEVSRNNSNIKHPYEDDLSFLYGTIFIGASQLPGIHSRNVCVFADGEVDRSPTGSGVAGRVALHFHKGQISRGEEIVIESITGSTFSGSVFEVQAYGPYQAVIPKVTGDAFIIGRHEFIMDMEDPLKAGFLLRE